MKRPHLHSLLSIFGASAAVLLPTLLGQGAPSSAEDPSPADTSSAGPCEAGASLSQENACDPADSLPDDDHTIDRIRAHAGDRFAGTWTDRDQGSPRIVVSLVGATAADQIFLDELAGAPGELFAGSATFSQSELEEVSDEATSALKGSHFPFLVGPDLIGNRVIVHVPAVARATARDRVVRALERSPDPRVERALALSRRAGADPARLIVVDGGFNGIANADTRSTYPKHTGGRRLTIDQIAGSRLMTCTSAFTVVSDGGASMGLTAGHCASGYLDDYVSIGSDYLSRSGRNSYRGSRDNTSDATRYELASPDDRDDNIFVNGATRSYRDLQAPRYTMDTLNQGDHLCFQGVTSDNDNCGEVIHANVNVSDDEGHLVRHQFVLNHPCSGGDSGGPVYHVRSDGSAKAAGVVKGAAPGMCFFSQIGYALDDVDASL